MRARDTTGKLTIDRWSEVPLCSGSTIPLGRVGRGVSQFFPCPKWVICSGCLSGLLPSRNGDILASTGSVPDSGSRTCQMSLLTFHPAFHPAYSGWSRVIRATSHSDHIPGCCAWRARFCGDVNWDRTPTNWPPDLACWTDDQGSVCQFGNP
jgi:hypothetical protein